MLNRYVWKLYLKSGGSKTVDIFRKNLGEKLTDRFAEEIVRLRKAYCVIDTVLETTMAQLKDLYGFYSSPDYVPIDETMSPDEHVEEMYEAFIEDTGSPADAFASFSYGLDYISTDLSIAFPDFFIPYYYRNNFNVLQKIADTFDIVLPEIPAKKDYKGRVYYYLEISKVFISFMKENGLSTYELYAFLYDFAPKYVGGTDSYLIKELPAPTSAYFIGADSNDQSLAQNKGEVTIWQCNPDTRAGDMIVMYLRTPVSAINSIWQACSLGFIDPFFFYYRCVYISNPVEIKLFTLNEIRKDHVFKKLPIVRKNMQGINGVELYPSVYNHLVEVSNAKVPALEYSGAATEGEYVNEKAVETKLIKPLIERLGYEENEYKQQMYVEIGNHNKALIPDFVLLPNERRGFASGFAIIEAKRSIKNEKEFREVLVQASSYAKILTAKYCTVASMEKIWITQRNDNYDKVIFESSWEKLNDTDRFYELNRILGR